MKENGLGMIFKQTPWFRGPRTVVSAKKYKIERFS